MPQLLDLPAELQLRVARGLDIGDAINLARSSTVTIEMGESQSWSSIKIPNQGTSCSDSQSIRPTIDQEWAELKAALERRPQRRGYMRQLDAYLTPDAVSLLRNVLASPSAIDTLRLEVDRIGSLPILSPIVEIGLGESLPCLTHLSVDEELATDRDVYACLRKTPNLASLTLRLVAHDQRGRGGSGSGLGDFADWEGTFQITEYARRGARERNVPQAEADGDPTKTRGATAAAAALMDLPKLARLDITAEQWPNIVANIMDHAPNLESLRVRCGFLELSGGYAGNPASLVPHEVTRVGDVFRNERIRSFDADDGSVQYILGDMPTKIPRDWMPDLKRLSMWHMPSPGRMPRHAGLEELVFWHLRDEAAEPMIDNVPSDTTTGLLATWIIQALAGELPSLTRIAFLLTWDIYSLDQEERRFDGAFRPLLLHGFDLMVFCNTSGEALYHARAGDPFGGLDTAALTRREDVERGPPLDELPDADAAGTARSESVAPYSEGVIDGGPASMRDDEFTYYRGVPLSMKLLRWVYREAGIEWAWKQGARDVKLPERVWEHLRRCRERQGAPPEA